MGGDKLPQCTKAQAQYERTLPVMWLVHGCQSGRILKSSTCVSATGMHQEPCLRSTYCADAQYDIQVVSPRNYFLFRYKAFSYKGDHTAFCVQTCPGAMA